MGLFAFFASLLLASCTKPEESLGEGIQPSEDLLYTFVTDSVQINATTEKVDSLRTDLFANVLVGNYVDDQFGAVKCRAVMQFSPDFTVTSLPENLEVRSVVLSLAYQQESYGNNTPMYFEVNELTEPIFLDSAYYTTDHPQKSYTNLILPGREIQNTNPEYASLIPSDPLIYLDLPLSTELGTRLLANDSVLKDFDAFTNYFKGLVIGSQTINGRVLNFSNIHSKITVNYSYPGVKKTLFGKYEFDFNTSCEAFSTVDQNYFGSPLSQLSPNNGVSSQTDCYLQSGGGTRLKLDLSDVHWLNQNHDVLINSAELILPFDASSKYNEVDSLTLVYEKEPGVFSLTRDYTRTAGNYRKFPGHYSINVTSHIQSIINNAINVNEITVVANPRITGYYNTIGIRRSLIHGPEYSATDPTQNLRLVISYSYLGEH